MPEFSARQHIGATAFDASRSFIDHISPFPDNIEAEATATYTSAGAGRGGGGRRARRRRLGGGAMRGTSATIVLHHSMVRLPEKPMMPRLFDERVGYFTTRQQDYTADEYRVAQRAVHRALAPGKERPCAAVSEPVKPIVYYIDSATPKKWVPWLKKGIEDWNEAFAAAGFSNAIIGKTAPTAQEDPDFSPEDVRYSVIRWLPSTTENASGPHISDPRTGEILNADIQFYHNVMNLARDWYFVQVGPLDPRAQKLPLPDDLMGRLLEYVVCHEVGHTLGFQHNMKASSMYPAGQDPRQGLGSQDGPHAFDHGLLALQLCRAAGGWHRGGRSDPAHRPVRRLGHQMGLYADRRREALRRKKSRRSTSGRASRTTRRGIASRRPNSAGSDPGEETEAVGDADAMKSTAMGMKNLQRVAKMLMPATAWKDGETYEDLSEVYGRMLSQWQTGDEPCGAGRGRTQQPGEGGRPGRPRLHAGSQSAAGRGGEVPGGQRVRHAHVDDRSGDSAPHRGQRRADAHSQRAEQRVEPVAERSALRAPDRAADARRHRGVHRGRIALATVRKGVWKELDGAHGEDRRLSAQSAERVSRAGQHQAERGHGAGGSGRGGGVADAGDAARRRRATTRSRSIAPNCAR